MTYWMISCEEKGTFNLSQVYEDLKLFDWTQLINYSVGDIVYIYTTKPTQLVTHKCIVEKTDIETIDMLDMSKYWIDKEKYKNGCDRNRWVRLRFVKKMNDDFSLKLLDINPRGLQKGMRLSKEKVIILEDDNYQFAPKQDEKCVPKPQIIVNADLVNRYVKQSTISNRKPNYEEISRKRTAIGMKAEEYVYEWEKIDNPSYSDSIKRVGDDPSYHYDIKSFDKDGKEKHIEVKTCSHGDIDKVDFYITADEYEKLLEDPLYVIYYVFGMRTDKRTIIMLKKADLENVDYKPVAFKITAMINGINR